MKRSYSFLLSAIIFSLLTVPHQANPSLWACADELSSGDQQVRQETERGPWDRTRKTWDTAPATYIVQLPDYHHSADADLRDQSSAAYGRLRAVAQEALKWVNDSRLSTPKRLEAVTIVELFSVDVTADRLIDAIELKDEREVFFTDVCRGDYPIVTVLASYGHPVVPHVNFALSKERPPLQRDLLCGVLVKVLGTIAARDNLHAYASGKDRTRLQRACIESAVAAIGDGRGQD